MSMHTGGLGPQQAGLLDASRHPRPAGMGVGQVPSKWTSCPLPAALDWAL